MSLFTVSELRKETQKFGALSKSFYAQELKKGVDEFSPEQVFDIFMSHSKLDEEIIYGLKIKIENMGYSVYIDWDVDRQLDRSKVDKETALLLKRRMQNCSCLFFAISDSSIRSIWMPWELGYFDGYKGRVAILPISNYTPADDSYKGQEYLGVYPYVSGGVASKTNRERLWIHESPSKYIVFDEWLIGKEPIEHR